MSDSSEQYPQNDVDRARGLISDGQGEFVQEHPGGAFDPRAFRPGRPATAPADDDAGGGGSHRVAGPPMSGNRMTAPGSESDKTG